MATIDFGAGYRDATKGATLKALQLRRQEAAEAQQQLMAPRQISSPWQGAGDIANVISGGIREGRAAADEQAGRARFAELLAGGLSPEEMGEAMMLDPEMGMKYQEREWTKEDTANERTYTEGRDLVKHGWDVDEAAARVTAEQEAAKQSQGATAALQEDQQAAAILTAQEKVRTDAEAATQAAKTEAEVAEIKVGAERETARLQELLDRRSAELQSELDTKKTLATTSKITAVPPEVAAARGGDIAKNPQDYQFDTLSQEITPVQRARSPADIKAIGDFEGALIETRSTLGNLRKALELAPSIFEGSGGFGLGGARQRADAILKTPRLYGGEGSDLVKQATATKAYFNIMGEQAIKAMSNTLAGATTEFEMKRFIEIMADESIPLAVKQQEIGRMMTKVEAHEKRQATQVGESRGNVDAGAEQLAPPPTDTNTPPAPDAAAAPAGGEPEAPTMQEGDEEGDTGTDDNGFKWIVRGGQWVRA